MCTQCVPGSGDDIIVLPTGARFLMSKVVADAGNPMGPTATPMVTSKITILANGAKLEHVGSLPFRLFSVGHQGHLIIKGAYIEKFLTRGGNGAPGGGGGGMGAGGAIFVAVGVLEIDDSTFAFNAALGGGGGKPETFSGAGGGGGGLGGHGGRAIDNDDCSSISIFGAGGGGGGGARGNGGSGFCSVAGNGGGTFGFFCGGTGFFGDSTQDALCAGGGGAGGSGAVLFSSDGGRGEYGGGGGGGADGGGGGGNGGLGGGGGAGYAGNRLGASGGRGGLGGGGGAGPNGSIADGEPGAGGRFGGNANSSRGGGGAGLGGAIFNDRGTVVVRNSTFTGNTTRGGPGGGTGQSGAAQGGQDAGAAIFSRNGQLVILNSTINGNPSVEGTGGGIYFLQDDLTIPSSFSLRNTIVANNGSVDCSVEGSSISSESVGNLIQNNGNCPGATLTGDPLLGPLQNNQGPTPTMAIGLTSPALNAADPTTSRLVDQRGQTRPEEGGFDIGAFELCLIGSGHLTMPCPIIAGVLGTEALTMITSPAGGGVTAPPSGTSQEVRDSIIPVTARPSPGFRFTNWSSNVASPGAPTTTIVMTGPQTVTATFVACNCATDVTAVVGVTLGGISYNPFSRRYSQIVTLRNNTAGPITGPLSLVLDNLSSNATLLNPTGSTILMLPSGSPYVNASPSSLAAAASVSITLLFTNPTDTPISYTTRVLAGPGSR